MQKGKDEYRIKIKVGLVRTIGVYRKRFELLVLCQELGGRAWGQDKFKLSKALGQGGKSHINLRI